MGDLFAQSLSLHFSMEIIPVAPQSMTNPNSMKTVCTHYTVYQKLQLLQVKSHRGFLYH